MEAIVEFVNLEWPYAKETILVAYVLLGCCVLSKGPCKGLYWAHSLVLTVLSLFGGGILAPFLIGRPPVVFVNDLLPVVVIACWYLTQRIPSVIIPATHLTGPLQILTLLAELMRFTGVVSMVDVAFSVISAGPYYPMPVWGPIMLGTIAGAGALFVPFDKGLSGIKDGAPYKLQSAFYLAVAYHFLAHDANVSGFVSSIVGTYSRRELVAALVGGTTLASVAQTIVGESFNIFAPINSALALIIGSSSNSTTANNEAKAKAKKNK